MSLINDALKQARKSQQPNPPSAPPPLRPVEPAPRGITSWLLPLAVVVLVCAAVFFLGLSLSRHKPSPANATANAPELSPTPPSAHVPAVTRATNAPAASNIIAAVPPPPPGPKLQGVFYAEKPWAIVDGKTIYVGDRVGGLRVMEISRNSITLENPDGSRKKLGLGE